ncbi:MAG: GPW/gp25 family protein [Saprospiraceae bacterium]
MLTEHAFLGRGWSFPPTFHHPSGSVVMVAMEEDIFQSLSILLTTLLGERIMQPSYGCNLEALLFESVDTSTQTLIADQIETAILYHEPRIKPERIELIPQLLIEGMVRIEVDFTIRSTNTRHNFVFPFYKEEGINLQESISPNT